MKHLDAVFLSKTKAYCASRAFSKFREACEILLYQRRNASIVHGQVRCYSSSLPRRNCFLFEERTRSMILSSILGTVFNRGSVIRCAALLRFHCCKLCRFYVLCRRCKLSDGNVYIYIYIFFFPKRRLLSRGKG